MAGLLFSIIISVSLVTVMVFATRRQIVRRYGFKVLYILSFILALRLLIPYSVQIPSVLRLNIVIPWWVFAVWGIGTAVSILCHTANYFYSRRRIMRCGRTCSDEGVLSLLKEEKRKLFIDSDIPLLISKEVGSPMLVGMLSPVIVLPSAPYTHDEYRMIFRHELLHYRNKDSIKKLFFMLVVSVCWFNPFAYLLMRESSNSLECICDEGVLKNTDTQYKQDYCMMLLKTGNSTRFIPITSNLNTKEMLKMRINSIFEKKNKRSGGMLIVSVILCLSILSSILCSCTVETPQDVLDEMERVENSVNNENEAGTVSVDYELHPVSEVIANAPATIEEWNTKDGIFKFDNCRIALPDAEEFIVYKYDYDVGIKSAQDKLDMFDALEEKYFGKDYFTEEEMLYVPASGTHNSVDEMKCSREEFLKSDGKTTYLGGYTGLGTSSGGDSERYGSLQYMALATTITTAYYDEHRGASGGKIIDCDDRNALETTAELSDGSIVSLTDVVDFAQGYANSLEFYIDEKISFKADYIQVPRNGGSVEVFLRTYCDGVPFVNLLTKHDIPHMSRVEIDARFAQFTEHCDLIMMQEGGFEFIWAPLTYTEMIPTGESYMEIISVEQVMEILKDTFSNQTVYNVTEFSLGNVFVANEGEYFSNNLDFRTIPIYHIVLKITGNTINVWIDARTGGMNYCIEN